MAGQAIRVSLGPLTTEDEVLRFAEVFTERGGFDVLLGNPPWLKVSWDESGVLGEYDPMIVMKDLSATEVVAERNRILEAEVLELKSGMETVEERARHELGMLKEGETLYQLAE